MQKEVPFIERIRESDTETVGDFTFKQQAEGNSVATNPLKAVPGGA